MRKLSSTEAELKKSITHKKKTRVKYIVHNQHTNAHNDSYQSL